MVARIVLRREIGNTPSSLIAEHIEGRQRDDRQRRAGLLDGATPTLVWLLLAVVLLIWAVASAVRVVDSDERGGDPARSDVPSSRSWTGHSHARTRASADGVNVADQYRRHAEGPHERGDPCDSPP